MVLNNIIITDTKCLNVCDMNSFWRMQPPSKKLSVLSAICHPFSDFCASSIGFVNSGLGAQSPYGEQGQKKPIG